MPRPPLNPNAFSFASLNLVWCGLLGLSVNDAEIIRTNSTGLVIYNPKNLADRIKSMKNRNVSRKDKILARIKYEEQAKQ